MNNRPAILILAAALTALALLSGRAPGPDIHRL